MTRRDARRPGIRVAAVAVLLAVALCSPAAAQIYWANQDADSIGRASLDGRRVDRHLIGGVASPHAVALDGTRVYWTQTAGAPAIGRANLDGSGAERAFLATEGVPQAITLDAGAILWTHTVAGTHWIGRASRDGARQDPDFVPTRTLACGIAADPDKLYWSNGGSPGTIGHSHGGFDPEQDFIARAGDPCGVAVTHRHVYWADRAGNAIGRARLDGSHVERRFVPAFRPCGVAVDGRHVYWTSARGTVGRSRVDGTRVDHAFVTGARGPCGVAVAPTATARPARHAFRDTAVGRGSALEAFVVRNRGSSPLAVTAVEIVGRHRRDFEVTGDGCVVNLVPAGGACIVNVRFAPASPGPRRARLRFVSNAGNSPESTVLAGRATRR